MISIEERKQKWLDFYSGKERTVVFIEPAEINLGKRPIPMPANAGLYCDWSVSRYHAQLKAMEWLDDDRIPCVSALTGTEIFAAAFGCPVHYPEDNMPFARPCVFSMTEAARLKQPVLENSPTLMNSIEMGLKLRKAAPDAMIQLPDIQSPLDIAALIWEKADFFMAMYDEGKAVKDLIDMTGKLLTEFLELWFKTFGAEFIAHFPEYYMQKGITLSEDEIGSINNELFMEYAYPWLKKLSLHFGGNIGIHCCANAKHQYGLLKTIPGLMLLNLYQDDNVIREASSGVFRDGPPLWVGEGQNEIVDFRARPVLLGRADTKEKAIERLKQLREYADKFSCPGNRAKDECPV